MEKERGGRVGAKKRRERERGGAGGVGCGGGVEGSIVVLK